MSEIHLGEQLMGLGDIEAGVEHLANAVAVTSQVLLLFFFKLIHTLIMAF